MVEPATPPSPAPARTRNTPIAIKKTADTPRSTSLLTRLPGYPSSSSSLRLLLSFRRFSFMATSYHFTLTRVGAELRVAYPRRGGGKKRHSCRMRIHKCPLHFGTSFI